MRLLTELDDLDALDDDEPRGRATLAATPLLILVQRGFADNDPTCEEPAIPANDVETWARHALAANGFGGVTLSAAGIRQVVQSAHVRRADFFNKVIAAATQAIRGYARKAQLRRRQRQQAKAIGDALYELDDHLLRDLGFSRSEITSIAAEATGEAERTRVRTLCTSHGFPN